jgi:hypothetical protein
MDELNGDYAVAPLHDNVAEKILGLFSQEKTAPQPGRPIAIDDGRLWGARDHLVWLFEVTWADVGERVPWIKKPADVLNAVRVWDNPNQSTGSHYIAKCLLRPSAIPATPKWLTVKRRELGVLNEAARSTWDAREKCRQALEVAQRALSPDLSEAERTIVQDQISRRAQKFSEADAEHLAASDRQKKMQDLLSDGEASFARAEFVRFCQSNRYRLNPLNIANALAGLPYIGWRQSAKRCKNHPAPGADGRSMQLFKTIDRIVRSCVRRADLVGHAERWLRAQKAKKSLGISELQEKWYYLRWSIKTALEATPRVSTRDLPFAITREYWKRISRPSNVDLLFEEEERIVN